MNAGPQEGVKYAFKVIFEKFEKLAS